MKLTESYLRNMIKQVLHEVSKEQADKLSSKLNDDDYEAEDEEEEKEYKKKTTHTQNAFKETTPSQNLRKKIK
jgi:hypothetical protein